MSPLSTPSGRPPERASPQMTSTGLTRQNLPVLDRTPVEYAAAAGVARGGYVLSDGVGKDPDVLLVATGSEVQIALDAQQLLADDSIEARVVSMPCREWFTQQALDYQDEVLPSHVRARVSVEAAVGQRWREVVGDAGMDHLPRALRRLRGLPTPIHRVRHHRRRCRPSGPGQPDPSRRRSRCDRTRRRPGHLRAGHRPHRRPARLTLVPTPHPAPRQAPRVHATRPERTRRGRPPTIG